MENKTDLETLRSALTALKGEKCWSVIAGSGTGSLLTMAFGGKKPRQHALSNNALTREQREFEGEYELYIECAWRLESSGSVLCTSTSSNHMNGPAMLHLEGLAGTTVSDVEVSSPAADIKITFANAQKFLVFADQANETEDYINYTFSDPRLSISIGSGSTITLTKSG